MKENKRGMNMEGFTKIIAYMCNDCHLEFDTETECTEHMKTCRVTKCREKYLGKYFVSRTFMTDQCERWIHVISVSRSKSHGAVIGYDMVSVKEDHLIEEDCHFTDSHNFDKMIEEFCYEEIDEKRCETEIADYMAKIARLVTSGLKRKVEE